jgi:hypothetical protein
VSQVSTVTEQEQAQAALGALRKAMRRFYYLRNQNQLALIGADPKVKLKPREVRAILLECRDPVKEREAAAQVRDLLYGINGREPTVAEMQHGLLDDEGMGFWPALIGLVATAGGSAALTSMFNYLSRREETAQARIRPPGAIQQLGSAAGQTAPIIVALTVLGVGGYLGWRFLLKKKPETVREAAKEPPTEAEEVEE